MLGGETCRAATGEGLVVTGDDGTTLLRNVALPGHSP
jgi:hypothetical protein